MNDIPENGPQTQPALSLAQAHARLTAPGMPFETKVRVVMKAAS